MHGALILIPITNKRIRLSLSKSNFIKLFKVEGGSCMTLLVTCLNKLSGNSSDCPFILKKMFHKCCKPPSWMWAQKELILIDSLSLNNCFS